MKQINAAAVNTLSATGSNSAPKLVSILRRRASQPSSQSVNAAMPKTTSARVLAPGNCGSNIAATKMPVSPMRARVRRFGRFIGADTTGCRAPEQALRDEPHAVVEGRHVRRGAHVEIVGGHA